MKHERERGRDLPVLEEIIGPPAYRGRNQHIAMKKNGVSSLAGSMGRSGNQRRPLSRDEMRSRSIPHNTRRSERQPVQRRQQQGGGSLSDGGMDFR